MGSGCQAAGPRTSGVRLILQGVPAQLEMAVQRRRLGVCCKWTLGKIPTGASVCAVAGTTTGLSLLTSSHVGHLRVRVSWMSLSVPEHMWYCDTSMFSAQYRLTKRSVSCQSRARVSPCERIACPGFDWLPSEEFQTLPHQIIHFVSPHARVCGVEICKKPKPGRAVRLSAAIIPPGDSDISLTALATLQTEACASGPCKPCGQEVCRSNLF